MLWGVYVGRLEGCLDVLVLNGVTHRSRFLKFPRATALPSSVLLRLPGVFTRSASSSFLVQSMQGVASFFRRSATEIGGNLRLSFSNLVRSYSAEASASSSAASASQQATKKRKRRKKKNLFEVAQFLPNWGLGYHLAKGHWDGVYYKITKINLYKDGRHGKAWGVFYKDGLPTMDAPKKISGVHKRCWRYIPDSSRRASDTGLKSEVQPEVQA